MVSPLTLCCDIADAIPCAPPTKGDSAEAPVSELPRLRKHAGTHLLDSGKRLHRRCRRLSGRFSKADLVSQALSRILRSRRRLLDHIGIRWFRSRHEFQQTPHLSIGGRSERGRIPQKREEVSRSRSHALMDGYDNRNNRDDERNNRDDNRPFRDPPICFGGVWVGRAQSRRHCSDRRDAVIENVTSAAILRFNSLPRRVILILIQ